MKRLCSSTLLALALTASSAPADPLPIGNPTDLSATFSRAGLTPGQVSARRNGSGLRPVKPGPSDLGGPPAIVPAAPTRDRNTLSQANGHNRDCDSRQPQTLLVVFYNNPVSYDPSAYYQEVQDYYQPGYQWGVGLRDNSMMWDGFVPYLKEYIAAASEVGQDAFRDGFVAGFGGNAEALFDRAARRAYR
jgi:hypothetical protein